MNFISLTFVCLFPVVLLLYRRVPGPYRVLFLLAVSYFFYIRESSYAGIFLFLTTLLTYVAGKEIARGRHKKAWLFAAVTVCLGLLVGLKYSVPPVGISFYTFQTLAYVIDVYKGEIKAEKSFISYALFVSFFPQLVAGPIERAGNLLSQLKTPGEVRKDDYVNGLWWMLRGFYKKVVVADTLAVYVDRLYADPVQAGGVGVILGTAFFAVQIYCDFSGYTDIARGAARLLGIRLMENFRHPYRAVGIQDFWKRWHISLTKWFTDYVYIPLGGSKQGLMRQVRNVLIVFLLSGFWHGAALHYVVWGLLHGIYMAAAILWQQVRPKKTETKYALCGRLWTQLLVGVAWVFFRAPSVEIALQILKQPFVNPSGQGFWPLFLPEGVKGTALLGLMVVLISFLLFEQVKDEIQGYFATKRGVYTAAILFVVMVTAIEFSWLSAMAQGGENAFIYFRF